MKVMVIAIIVEALGTVSKNKGIEIGEIVDQTKNWDNLDHSNIKISLDT